MRAVRLTPGNFFCPARNVSIGTFDDAHAALVIAPHQRTPREGHIMHKHIATPTIETLWLNMNAECDHLWEYKAEIISGAVALGVPAGRALDQFLDMIDAAEMPYRWATNEGNKL